jgi:hypothetical protein
LRITDRDVRIVRDLAMSHAMSRDQLIELFFGTVTRANTRLRELQSESFVRRIATPFFTQGIYSIGPNGHLLLGERIERLVANRTPSPRFLQHALCVTNVRLDLVRRGAKAWRFEQQASCSFRYRGKPFEVRPDGLAILPKGIVAVEVDLGHVAPAKYLQKLKGYAAFIASGECNSQWDAPTFSLLTVTTGKLRAARLSRLVPPNCNFEFRCETAEALGIAFPGSWS